MFLWAQFPKCVRDLWMTMMTMMLNFTITTHNVILAHSPSLPLSLLLSRHKHNHSSYQDIIIFSLNTFLNVSNRWATIKQTQMYSRMILLILVSNLTSSTVIPSIWNHKCTVKSSLHITSLPGFAYWIKQKAERKKKTFLLHQQNRTHAHVTIFGIFLNLSVVSA